MNSERLKDIAIGLGFVALQIVFLRHLKIYAMEPDVILVFLIWYMSKKDRTSAIIMAAVLGFTQDAMLDLWGLNMFCKTLTVFATYNFIPKSHEVRLLLGQVFVTVVVIALFHNLIFVGISSIIEHFSAEFIFWRQWIGNSIYTAIVGSFIHLFRTS